MFEQVIPVGSVGYIDPMTTKFIVLFNAIDPGSSTDGRLDSIPSLLDGGATKLVVNPNYSSSVWDEDHGTHFESLYDIIVGEFQPEHQYISLGRACCKELVGTHFETWALDHKQKILDIFGDEHPYIRKRLDLVTSVIDSSQYAWFAHLGFSSRFRSPGPFFWHPFFHFRIAHPPVPGTPWGEFKMPKYYDPPNLLSWSHVSTVGQSPMTADSAQVC
ncbi:uncharacterized protein ARMOST_04488 [Armillaria ostoyae]|uniref:Uncharacterized protein n=1 Tax=Armillaria ostoyae TaxID=47428 RepID=A0A284QXI6_ARMOS|nr:uncharacterized protein ARMOST_04488 [Armillaria ostoyae]